MTKRPQDWDPASAGVLRDPVAAYDEMRRRCPVAHSELLEWSLFRHEEVAKVIADPKTFSNVVSSRRSVPNGMDPPEHTAYRQAIEPYLGTERVQSFEPVCRGLAQELFAAIVSGAEVDFMEAFALPFAVRCQCAFLGWPERLAAPVRDWTRRNREAILVADRSALSSIANEFEAFIARLVEERRADDAPDDLTTELMRTRVDGRPLTHAELTSILRNWTVGEVGSMAAALGILAGRIAATPELQRSLREVPAQIPAAIEEVLRVEGPLVSNRRRVTRDVTLGGRRIPAGDRLSLMWISANRDESVFEEPDSVHLERDQRANLLWGAGVHVCPGAGLARLEMRVALEELLSSFDPIVPGGASPKRLTYPENGWATLPLRLA